MEKIIIFLGSMLLVFATVLFGAWVVMEMYNLCILPLSTEHFTLPQISYSKWLMVYLFVGYLRLDFSKKNNINIETKEGILRYASRIFTMLFYMLIAWIFNLIIF